MDGLHIQFNLTNTYWAANMLDIMLSSMRDTEVNQNPRHLLLNNSQMRTERADGFRMSGHVILPPLFKPLSSSPCHSIKAKFLGDFTGPSDFLRCSLSYHQPPGQLQSSLSDLLCIWWASTLPTWPWHLPHPSKRCLSRRWQSQCFTQEG